MDSISKIISKNFNAKGAISRGVAAAQVVEIANTSLAEHFGPEYATIARAVFFREGILTIACSSSVSGQEVKLAEQKLCSSMNRQLDLNLVKQIRCLS